MRELHDQRKVNFVLASYALGFCLLTITATVLGSATSGLPLKVLPSVMSAVWDSPGTLLAAAHYLVAYIGVHVLGALAWGWVWRPIGERLVERERGARLAGASFLPVLLLTLLVNARYFPESSFATSAAPAVAAVLQVVTWLIALYVSGALIVGIWLRLGTAAARWTLAACVAAALGSWWLMGLEHAAEGTPRRSQADVIIIGIDSLRPDHVDASLTPALTELLSESVRIEHAWTPLARTFPAWVSVLTGQYPSTHGGRFNLVHRDLVDDSNSLAHQLGSLGYQRLYAIDETRFSNIDRSFGFDRVAGPPIGAFDFVMSAVGDLPAVNLLSGTPIGRFLFPYAHGNRALEFSYRPEVFDRMLAREIDALDPGRPLFLAVHFELPHWPFTWAGSGGIEVDAPAHLLDESTHAYRRTISRVDRQLAALLAALEEAGRLRSSALVVLSDHGEAFWDREPHWERMSGAGGTLLPDSGHGTHVLSAVQNRVLLAFRGYGEAGANIEPAFIRGATVSLVDIRPTLGDWLGMPVPGSVALDGESLWPLLQGGPVPDGRIVTIETGFSPPSVTAGTPDVGSLVASTSRYYDIDAAGRLSLRVELLPELKARKQRAAVAGDTILGAMPAPFGSMDSAVFVLGDFGNRRFVELYAQDDRALAAPVPLMLTELCRRFAGEIEIESYGCAP